PRGRSPHHRSPPVGRYPRARLAPPRRQAHHRARPRPARRHRPRNVRLEEAMKIGRSHKQHPVSGAWDIIVVGSALGGLAAAGMLARHAGRRVLVLERHYTAGGFTHTFTRPGWEWDVGVHYIGDVHRPGSVLRRVFDELSDGELEWADMGDVYDTIVI